MHMATKTNMDVVVPQVTSEGREVQERNIDSHENFPNFTDHWA